MNIIQTIEHTLLDPEADEARLDAFLDEAISLGGAGVCVSPWMARRAVERCAGSGLAVASVVGFPTGSHTTEAKLAEAVQLAELGADELDLVINRSLINSSRLDEAVAEVEAIAGAIAPVKLKVILECPKLGAVKTAEVAQALVKSDAAWLKTCSGYFGPATVEDVALLRGIAPAGMGVKAAGGIRSLEDARAMVEAGADRLGTSSGAAIVKSLP